MTPHYSSSQHARLSLSYVSQYQLCGRSIIIYRRNCKWSIIIPTSHQKGGTNSVIVQYQGWRHDVVLAIILSGEDHSVLIKILHDEIFWNMTLHKHIYITSPWRYTTGSYTTHHLQTINPAHAVSPSCENGIFFVVLTNFYCYISKHLCLWTKC